MHISLSVLRVCNPCIQEEPVCCSRVYPGSTHVNQQSSKSKLLFNISTVSRKTLNTVLICYYGLFCSHQQNNRLIINLSYILYAGACPGIRKRGGPKSESLFFFFFFFFCFSIFQGGGPAQKLAEKMTFSTKKVGEIA